MNWKKKRIENKTKYEEKAELTGMKKKKEV